MIRSYLYEVLFYLLSVLFQNSVNGCKGTLCILVFNGRIIFYYKIHIEFLIKLLDEYAHLYTFYFVKDFIINYDLLGSG